MEEAIKTFFKSINKMSKYKNKTRISYSTPKLEVDCMIRSIDLDTRTPISHGMPKLHKSKGNLPPCRLVVEEVGSPFHCISRCVDMCLRQLLDQTPSYVKNSTDIVLMLNALDELEDVIFLFATDATTMCPNINTEEGLIFLKIILNKLIFKVDPNSPKKLLML